MRLFETINDAEKSSITSKDSNPPAHNELTATDDSIFSFKDLQLKVNDKLQIQLASVAKKSYNPTRIAYYSTRLIGYYQNYGLMVSEPRLAKINEYPLFESDELFIFYFNGQTLFKFASYVEKIITLPFKYLHLSFPKHISGKQIRKSKRIGVNIEATVNNNPSPAIITDISTTGAKIETNQEIGSFNAAVDLAFEISLHGYSTKLQLKGNVQSFNISHANAQNPLCYGIKFTSLQHNQKLLLQNLIYQKLINELY